MSYPQKLIGRLNQRFRESVELYVRLFGSPERLAGTIAVVTANFGGIDDIKALPPHVGIDAFYYTDEATLREVIPDAAQSWTRIIVPNYPRHDFNPRLRGRYFKHQIHRLDEIRGYRWLAWADSSIQFTDLSFLTEWAAALSQLPAHKRALLVPHPDRKTITEEFEFIQQAINADHAYLITRYASEKMSEQMEYFQIQGWNLNASLWCGTVWMIENSELMHRAWDAWWDQNLRFGMMDQLSLPMMLDAHGIQPRSLPVRLWDNQYFCYVGHRKEM